MTEDQAIAKAFKILQKETLLTEEDGIALKKLEPHIDKTKFEDLWSGYLTQSNQFELEKA